MNISIPGRSIGFCMLTLLATLCHGHQSSIAGTYGTNEEALGRVQFEMSCDSGLQKQFNRAMALLHSFEYDEARKAFNGILKQDRQCAMAYWGVAMSYLHQLWAPPAAKELSAGATAAAMAGKIGSSSERENGLIEAVNIYYATAAKRNHRSALSQYAKAMENLYETLPGDIEVALFYGLALLATADPQDKTFANQLRAGGILEAFLDKADKHPGLTHYIIHAYDTPELAHKALDAARRYAVIAPDSAHALHMPSHIFQRLGMWKDSIAMNLRSTRAARGYAEKAGIVGHWDEELHGLDFLTNAYLQVGDYAAARGVRDYIDAMEKFYPENFKIAYVLSATPARYVLEQNDWEAAAALPLGHPRFPWERFPWERSISLFAIAYGKARLSDVKGARTARSVLDRNAALLSERELPHLAERVEIQSLIVAAWIEFAEQRHDAALDLMRKAARLESATVIPAGAVIPADQILGDMYLALKQYAQAIEAYEHSLRREKRRRAPITNALAAATALKDSERIAHYRELLQEISN